ncbi:MAG: hypothetical protein ACI81R_000311, partial [Bradymonadia bacterium]
MSDKKSQFTIPELRGGMGPSSGDAANIDKVAPQAFVSSLPTHEAETPIAFDIYDTLELDV